jgi:hypothetical protein
VDQFERVIDSIRGVTEELRVYGVYRKGVTY